jgi:hypothetical protein
MGSEQRNGDAGSAAAAAIRQPRCKVCTSPHRPQIDAMLQAGQTQASVRVQFNALLGHDYFTRNNLSLHARKHLTPTPPNDAFATALAARFALPADAADLSPHAVASAILRNGLEALHLHLSVPTPKDLLAAAKELENHQQNTLQEALREFRAFSDAVQKVVPEKDYARIYAEFERQLEASKPA